MVLTTLLCCFAVVAFDAVASAASKMSRIPYSWFAIPQALVYVVMGFAVYRGLGMTLSFYFVLLCAAASEVTIGWWISAQIGPGKPSDMKARSLISSALSAVVFALLAGSLGGFVAKSAVG
jgi:hypothetical protein